MADELIELVVDAFMGICRALRPRRRSKREG